MDLIKTLTAQYMKPELPAMRVGDTVRVTVRVTEGNRERTRARGASMDHARVVDPAQPGVFDRHPGVADPTFRAGSLRVEPVGGAHEFDEHLTAGVRSVRCFVSSERKPSG